jgi:phage terminase large subunit
MGITLLSQYKDFTKPLRYKVVYGGRGKGATWQIARLLLLKAYENPKRILCTREYQNSINESVYHVLASQIELMGLVLRRKFFIKTVANSFSRV